MVRFIIFSVISSFVLSIPAECIDCLYTDVSLLLLSLPASVMFVVEVWNG